MTVEQLIYTDVPRGKGIDPTLAGFQIKACSPGLDESTRELLGAICRHYGDAVYRGASNEALDRESAWRAETASVSGLPDDVLDLFPEIWSYDELTDERYALTSVRYAGATHDGRFGNFVAHALVFEPASLASVGFNPLALVDSGLYLSRPPAGDATELPALDGFAPVATETDGAGVLLDQPFRDSLEELVGAACQASAFARPLLVRLDDWRLGVPLLRALLGALPPGRRCRTTFCTFENDRKWLPPSGPRSRHENAVAAHDAIVLAGRRVDVRPDEYRALYRVFNFVDGRFSEDGDPDSYAMFAGRCTRSGDRAALGRNHAALGVLGLDREPETWDALVGVEALTEGPVDGEALARYAAALGRAAREGDRTLAALELLTARLADLAPEAFAATAEQVADDFGRLAAVSADGPWLDAIRSMTAEAVAAGRGRLAGALARACGPRRDEVLLDVLPAAASLLDVLPRLPAPSDRERLSQEEKAATAEVLRDRERLVELLFDAAVAARGRERDDVFERMTETALGVASGAGALSDAWTRKGRALVESYLGDVWDARRREFAEHLAAAIDPVECPDCAVWLNERLIVAERLEGRELVAALERLARASAGAASGRKIAESVLRTARGAFRGAALAEALGHIADATASDTRDDLFYEAYTDELRGLDERERAAVRQRLVASGAARGPAREMLAAVLPWNPEAFETWWERFASTSPHAREALCEELAATLESEEGAPRGALECAVAVLERMETDEAGRARLLSGVVLAAPMAPISDGLAGLLAAGESELGEEALRRVEAMELLEDVAEHRGGARWSAGRFLAHFGTDDWPETVRALRREDKAAVLEFCLASFEAQGIQSPEDAEGFVLFLGAAGEATVDEITASIVRMLDGRDLVTCVVAAAALARCALGESSVTGAWVEILEGLVSAFDKETRRAFERHLALGFGLASAGEQRRLDVLARAAGVTPPSDLGSSARAGVTLKPPTRKETPGSIFGGTKWFFGKK